MAAKVMKLVLSCSAAHAILHVFAASRRCVVQALDNKTCRYPLHRIHHQLTVVCAPVPAGGDVCICMMYAETVLQAVWTLTLARLTLLSADASSNSAGRG
jgi:hypothetical protein